ncbi:MULTISPECIES: FtsX-like permease family protein [unclassified Halomonas]|uniref:ABC transporter permease n=1 Tax=Halomonadaceae TaxID=28256 RepID=UPI001EF472C7|nr:MULTISPECIES: FtsX-like permease family protein [unclassified Halomonas]MCG7577140.1 ABC transporter permease [Halomonas sp. MMH1-48]MCG7604205.1 ABC transporter permease [Halomonas sp. MM17-34]MCG7613454.1 ABC transporter permease [Halomonas sp. MM17-29]MCG7620228.1 ABC transporter permease [Halomonas sp. DSH1-27]
MSDINWRLAARSLKRDLRAADVRALFVALVLAVAASTMIAFFLDRLERGLERQAGQMLGGDLVLEQRDPFSDELRATLEQAGFTLSDQVDLVSMISQGERFQPASLKAVDDVYPHYGVSHVDRGNGVEQIASGPPPGEAWADPRLAELVEIAIGDRVQVGQAELTISGIIEREADQSAGFGNFNPRLMLNTADLESTGLVQPGSRIEFELLAAGPPEALDQVQGLLTQLRRDGVEVRDVRVDRPQLGNALQRAESYLGLAGLAAVLLAGVAVAMSTRRYVERHLDTAALLRCFGASQYQLVTIFSLQLLGLALMASLIGALLGLVGQAVLLWLLTSFLPMTLPPPGIMPLWLGIFTALAVLVGFAGPTLLRIKQVSALKVLRRELDPLPPAAWLVVGVASIVFGGLLWLYSGSFSLALALLVGGAALLSLLWGVSSLLLKGMLRALQRLTGGSEWAQALRLGGRQLARRKQAGLGQLLAFSVTFFAMAMIVLVRGDLLTTWQDQLPADTPNYFAINIQPSERDAFEQAVAPRVETQSTLYPMVRGRITQINGQAPREAVPPDARGDNSLRRELNLTWQSELPEGNQVVAGQWFVAEPQGWMSEVDATVSSESQTVPISVEDGLAERLGLGIGDEITFAVGSDSITTHIQSLRSLNWDSFNPNFFVIFPPGVLESFGHSFITAFHLPDQEQGLVRELVIDFPGVSLLNVDAILGQVRDVLTQVTRAVELVLVLVLLAGVSVLYAALTASRPVRAHESGLLRVFGAGNRMISRVQGAEYALLGFASGVLGALLAELATAALYLYWLDLTPRLHLGLWLALPIGGALLIGLIGHALSYSLRKQAPAASLGLLGEA